MNQKTDYPTEVNKIQYKEYSPTAFDTKGAFLTGSSEDYPDRQNWYVAPLSQTRDSGPLDRSNFEATLKLLGGEGGSVEVHRFGHWGPGWIEIILIDNNNDEKVAILDGVYQSLDNYPVLDEEDFSSREWDDYMESWENYGRSDFVHDILRPMFTFEGAEELAAGAGDQELRELFESGISSGEYYYTESDGVCVNLKSCRLTRQQVADFVHQLRSKNTKK